MNQQSLQPHHRLGTRVIILLILKMCPFQSQLHLTLNLGLQQGILNFSHLSYA